MGYEWDNNGIYYIYVYYIYIIYIYIFIYGISPFNEIIMGYEWDSSSQRNWEIGMSEIL